MKTKICLMSLILASSFPAWASLYSYGTLGGGSSLGMIPDNSTIGTMNLPNLSFTGTESGTITALTLTLQLTGASPSDLTAAYLRLGAGTGASGGYFALNTLLSANSANIASGTSFSIDLTTTSFGTAFNGKDATSGTWTLFFADTVPVDTTTLNGWSLDVTTVPAVPEPVNMALACFAGVLLTVVGVRRVVTRRALATN